jgi:hypothetical protein
MVQLFNLLALSALLLLLANGILSDAIGSRNAPSSGSKSPTEPVTYDIPDELGVHHESLREFKAVSSHGRAHDDEFEIHIPAKYSQLQVLLRASYLLLVFSPVFTTSGLAYISSIYRNLVWYGLLKFAISHSGAVSWSLYDSVLYIRSLVYMARLNILR